MILKPRIVHVVDGEVGPGNWSQAALCGAKPLALKGWLFAEVSDIGCGKCSRKLS